MNQHLQVFLGEFVGTAFLIMMGNGVVANVVYKRTKATNAGPFFISLGWALAVFLAVVLANVWETGGHLNPAVSIAMLTRGIITWTLFAIYISSQFLGALVGQLIVSAVYWNHANEPDNSQNVIHAHATSPTHPERVFSNLITEMVATTVLVTLAMIIVISYQSEQNDVMNDMMRYVGPLTMGLVVLSIGLSLGGVTGYAINPVRDFVPRLVYQLSPYKQKTSANWTYSWVPVVGPLIAGVIVGAFGRLI
ncbi:MIP/aquaporin family protein [Mycoplasma sp. ATU-Cv-508]|uniref:aquaporin n=1 Tax=Mycoplasma sp. ATU-Cv-508 TaxID=2048001 RepID=UPI000FDD4D2E